MTSGRRAGERCQRSRKPARTRASSPKSPAHRLPLAMKSAGSQAMNSSSPSCPRMAAPCREAGVGPRSSGWAPHPKRMDGGGCPRYRDKYPDRGRPGDAGKIGVHAAAVVQIQALGRNSLRAELVYEHLFAPVLRQTADDDPRVGQGLHQLRPEADRRGLILPNRLKLPKVSEPDCNAGREFTAGASS